jgi:ABC-type polar amino acid transport system ATPase subunit
MLVVHRINKALGGRPILGEVDLRVPSGEITVIIGPSGSGKTTLLRAISMVDPPDTGRITVDDFVYSFPQGIVSKGNEPWPVVTAVFQQLFLWPHLTLKQNIVLPIKHSASPVHGMERLDEIIDAFDMREFIDRYPNQASLGQRQRAALARALALRPRYLLLDEITSSLDVEQVSKILSQLKRLRDEGVGVLLITHLLGFARTAADSVVFLDNGRVVESGGREILTSPANERVRAFISII